MILIANAGAPCMVGDGHSNGSGAVIHYTLCSISPCVCGGAVQNGTTNGLFQSDIKLCVYIHIEWQLLELVRGSFSNPANVFLPGKC